MSKKRCRFDPIARRAAFTKQKTALSEYQEAYEKYSTAVQSLVVNNCLLSLISDLDPTSRDVEVLLVQVFGLKGVQNLKTAFKCVPQQLPTKLRIEYIKAIAHHLLPNGVTLTDELICSLAKLIDSQSEVNDATDLLRSVSNSSGVAYTAFLTPPVSCCLNNECRNFGIHNTL